MGLKEAEYTKLTNEIDSNSNRIFSMFGIVSAAFAALFGFGMEEGNPILIISSIIPAIPGLLLISSQYNSNARIVTYIKRVYEADGSGIEWEKNLAEFRDKYRGKRNKKIKSKYEIAINLVFGMFWFFATSLALFFMYYCETEQAFRCPDNGIEQIVFIVLFGIIQVGYIYGCAKLYFSRGKEKDYDKLWEVVFSEGDAEKTER